MQAVYDALSGNPYFSAGFGLLGVGSGLAVLRHGAIRGASFLQRYFQSTLEVSSRDPSYRWILQWLTHQTLRSGNHYSLQTRITKSSALLGPEAGLCVRESSFSLLPSTGIHYVSWRGRWLKIRRERDRSAVDLTTSGSHPPEMLTISTIGSSPTFFWDLVSDAKSLIAAQDHGRLVLYTSWANEWRPFGNARRKRALASVTLARGVAEAIMADVFAFIGNSQWYEERGIPYRRGYLLYGPPGGGKSSFVQALASELDYGICLLNLSEGMVTDDRFNHLLNVLPERTILLLEDVDAAICGGTNPREGIGKLSFSGLLNALDGVGSSEERIIFMTTNHYERLDPALVRPGRVDYEQYIGWVVSEQVERMFVNFYPEAQHMSTAFAAALALDDRETAPISPAAIQGHFILHKNDPISAVRTASSLRPARQQAMRG